MAYDAIPISAAFAWKTSWKKATRFQITPVQVLQRTKDFSLLEASDNAGIRLKIKVPRRFLSLFHTAHCSVIFAWKESGKLRFGCQSPAAPVMEDPFLSRDESSIVRTAYDPDYRPLQEFFEPWAQQWASSEQYAGLGMMSQADDLTEPWMEGKFGTATLPNEQGVSAHQQSNLDHHQVWNSLPTLPATGNFQPDDYPEPWAYNHVIEVNMALERTLMSQDQDEPWAYRFGNRQQGSNFDKSSYSGCHAPEWSGYPPTTSSTSTGKDDHTRPIRPYAIGNDEPLLHSNSRVSSTCYACISGFYHLLSRSVRTRISRSYPHQRDSLPVPVPSPPFGNWTNTDTLHYVGESTEQGDFVKQYWMQTSTNTHTKQIDFLDLLDLRQFCDRNLIRHDWNPRFGKQTRSCQPYGRQEPFKSTHDTPDRSCRQESLGKLLQMYFQKHQALARGLHKTKKTSRASHSTKPHCGFPCMQAGCVLEQSHVTKGPMKIKTRKPMHNVEPAYRVFDSNSSHASESQHVHFRSDQLEVDSLPRPGSCPFSTSFPHVNIQDEQLDGHMCPNSQLSCADNLNAARDDSIPPQLASRLTRDFLGVPQHRTSFSSSKDYTWLLHSDRHQPLREVVRLLPATQFDTIAREAASDSNVIHQIVKTSATHCPIPGTDYFLSAPREPQDQLHAQIRTGSYQQLHGRSDFDNTCFSNVVRYSDHLCPQHPTTSSGAVPDNDHTFSAKSETHNKCVALVFDLRQHDAFRRCPHLRYNNSPFRVINNGEVEDRLSSHKHLVASPWPSDFRQARSTPELHFHWTTPKDTMTAQFYDGDVDLMLQDQFVPVFRHVLPYRPWSCHTDRFDQFTASVDTEEILYMYNRCSASFSSGVPQHGTCSIQDDTSHLPVVQTLPFTQREPHDPVHVKINLASHQQFGAQSSSGHSFFQTNFDYVQCQRPQHRTSSSGAVPNDNRMNSRCPGAYDDAIYPFFDLRRTGILFQYPQDSHIANSFVHADCDGTTSMSHHGGLENVSFVAHNACHSRNQPLRHITTYSGAVPSDVIYLHDCLDYHKVTVFRSWTGEDDFSVASLCVLEALHRCDLRSDSVDGTSRLIEFDDATQILNYYRQHAAFVRPGDSLQAQSTFESQLHSTASKLSVPFCVELEEDNRTTPVPRHSTTYSGAVPSHDSVHHEDPKCIVPFDQTSANYLQFIQQTQTVQRAGKPEFPIIPETDALTTIPSHAQAGASSSEVYFGLPSRGHVHQLRQPVYRNSDILQLSHQPATSDDYVPLNADSPDHTFPGWSSAIYRGGHPAWGKCQIIHMDPNPSFDERCAAAMQDEGWLASDEALWFLRKLKEWRSDIAIGPMVQWSPSRDLHHFHDAENQLQYTNHHLNLQIFLVDAHWCAVEIDRRTNPTHVVLIQWPTTLQTTAVLEISRILQIPCNRLLVTVNDDYEVMTMCGWTILWRWYKNFAMETCLQQMIHVTPQHQEQFNRVIRCSQQYWNRTNATRELCRFATESRQAFLSEYARHAADTHLPPGASTTMFVGPTQEYIREVCQAQRSPTHREREINWLRTMLIQPAWLTNFEVEVVLQAVRFQMLDRYLPSPLHFNSTTETLEPFVNDLPSVAGYSKVLFFVTFHHHWLTISGLKHENRWMLTAAVPDPKSPQLPVLFSAIASILESSPNMVHIQAIETRSPPHLCGWILLHSLQDYVSLPMLPDTTLLLQRIATMPNSRIKTLLFEEALSTWTRHAQHQELVTFATQVRIFTLAHMDSWTSHHVIHFGGMFPTPTAPSVQASWNVVSQATKSKLLQKIRSHVLRPFVCPCIHRLTAYVEIDRRIASDDNIALFAAYIKPSPLQWASHFCQESVIHIPCSHTQVTEILIQVPKLSANLIPGRVEAIIYQGRVTGTAAPFVISILDLESGIRIFRHGRNHATLNLDIGEFCSGAFSGWTQASKVLETMGYSTATKFAIDHDPCVATWYARNFADGAIAAKPEDVFRLRDEAFYYREAPIAFQTDVQLGWYLLFCEPIEIATASPPCPAFSAASTSAGLEKAEGQVIIDTILKILILQPKVLVLEEVATLRNHAHFPLILELLNWGNFQVAWQEVLNLEDWLPQSRPRLLLVAFRRCSYGLKHFPCQPWQSGPSRPLSLRSSHCLLTDEAIIEITSAPLDFDTAKLYFDPSKIPGAVPRSFKDVIRFRLRTPDDRVQCLMASYAYGHEFDAASPSSKGIFGSLLRRQGRLRFLAGPELLWLQGLSVEWCGPLNSRLLSHIIGNAISVPHALAGLFNVLGHFAHLEFDVFPHELFTTAMASRLHSQNSDCIIDTQSGTFTITPKLVPATAPWALDFVDPLPLTRVVFLQGNKRRKAFVQAGLSILSVFQSLFSAYDVEHIAWLPFDRLGLDLPIADNDKFWGAQMTFSLPESYRLCLHEQMFHASADQWTIVLFPDQLIVHQVTATDTVASLSRVIAQDSLRPFHLCNHMLQKLDATTKPRQAIVARWVEPPATYLDEAFDGTFLDQGDWLQATLTTTEAELFLQTCHASGVTDLLWSLGWQMFQLQDPHPRVSCRQLNILPTSAQLFVDAVAIRNMLAAHITKWYLPPSVSPTTNTVRLSLKLWATVIWDGHVLLTAKTDIFAKAWEAASSFMGPLIPVRTILRGKRLSPEENFAGYIAHEDRESPLNRVHLIGVLFGGGNKTDLALRTNQMMTDFLFQNGASSISTPNFVKEVLMLAGVTRIQQILAMRDPPAKLEQIKQTALHFNVPLPEFADLDTDTTKRVRRFAAQRFHGPTLHKASEFTLPEGLFHDASGAPIANQADQTQLSGVFLLDAPEAQGFQETHQQTSLPCAMIILGPTCPLQTKQCYSCNLPASDSQGNKVVIATCIHYVGSAKVTLRGADQEDIPTESTSVIAFTAWQSETTAQLWSELQEGPLRAIWRVFAIEPAKSVVTRPCGRNWRADGRSVDPDKADSFQVHVRVYTSIVSTVLAQSGSQGIFVNPKTNEGSTIDPSYAIVWLRDKDKQQALEAAKKIHEQAGLVLSFKGKKGYGVRVPSSVYEEAQGILNPTLPKQIHIPATCYVKLSPLPHGVTQDDIRQWLDKQGLRMRPIRCLAANTWLLAASTRTDACHYLWGRSTVLIAPVQQNIPPQPTVLAGGIRNTTTYKTSMAASSTKDIQDADTWDPWANWNPVLEDNSAKHSLSEGSGTRRTWSSHGSQYSKSTASGSGSSASEILAIQNQIRDLTKATKTTQDNETQLRQDMQREFTKVRAEVRTQIEASEQSVRTTLDQRIHCIERSLQDTNASMKEGFSAILAKLGHSSSDDSHKRAKPNEAMQIDSSS